MSRMTTGLALALLAIGVTAPHDASATPAGLTGDRPAIAGAAATSLVHSYGRYRGHPYIRGRAYGYYAAPLYVVPDGCSWLRHRARETGSHYWWRRYRDCVDG